MRSNEPRCCERTPAQMQPRHCKAERGAEACSGAWLQACLQKGQCKGLFADAPGTAVLQEVRLHHSAGAASICVVFAMLPIVLLVAKQQIPHACRWWPCCRAGSLAACLPFAQAHVRAVAWTMDHVAFIFYVWLDQCLHLHLQGWAVQRPSHCPTL